MIKQIKPKQTERNKNSYNYFFQKQKKAENSLKNLPYVNLLTKREKIYRGKKLDDKLKQNK
jgi:hypothetical protein